MLRIAELGEGHRLLGSDFHQDIDEIRVKLLVNFLDFLLNSFQVFFLITFLEDKKIQDQYNKETNDAQQK